MPASLVHVGAQLRGWTGLVPSGMGGGVKTSRPHPGRRRQLQAHGNCKRMTMAGRAAAADRRPAPSKGSGRVQGRADRLSLVGLPAGPSARRRQRAERPQAQYRRRLGREDQHTYSVPAEYQFPPAPDSNRHVAVHLLGSRSVSPCGCHAGHDSSVPRCRPHRLGDSCNVAAWCGLVAVGAAAFEGSSENGCALLHWS